MAEANLDKQTQRIVMVIEFDGKRFHGWQRQDNAIGVQEALETALEKMEGKHVKTVAAGRTDAGVHGEAMLVHADVCGKRWLRSARAYTQGMNQHLPDTVVVMGVRAVADDFHARFSCLERRYCYRIWNRTTPSALAPWRHWWMPRVLDIEAMQAAAELLLGEHDFAVFQAAGCQAYSSVRNMRHISVVKNDWEVLIQVQADAFLYHMVRNIVGSLVQVGIGRWPASYMTELLTSKDRLQAAATAPAQGLYFSDAVYEDFTARSLIGLERRLD